MGEAGQGIDERLRALGIRRVPVPIPFPQAGGPVNVLAIDEAGGGFALIDAGLGTPDAEAALRAGLQENGLALPELRRILVTHGHIDHYGLAQTLREPSGARVFVHARDRDKLMRPGRMRTRQERYGDFLRRCGIPAASLEALAALEEGLLSMAREVEAPVEALEEGDSFRFARCELRTLHMPGHTPGQSCFVVTPDDGGAPFFLGADHLLERVSPNPLLELDEAGERFRALPHYYRSIRRAASLGIEAIVPGHGEPFYGPARVVETLFSFYERRQQRLLAAIPDEGATPVELLQRIFPKVHAGELFLMIGEVLGNLDVLEDLGRVFVDPGETEVRYRRAKEIRPDGLPDVRQGG